MDVLENLCDRMKLYRARPGPEFPYIKGGSYIKGRWTMLFTVHSPTAYLVC